MKPIKKIAMFHSLCSVGKASITNMLPILSTFGIECCPIPTILLSTHTGGYGLPAKQITDPSFIIEAADHYKRNNVHFDMIFVGYLGNTTMVKAILYFLEKFPDTTVVLDPIMGDCGNLYQNITSDYIDAYKKMLSYATIILPNITEACLLTEVPYRETLSTSDIKKIGEILNTFGIQNSIITSVCTESNNQSVALITQKNVEILEFQKEINNFHGTGDVFDAVLIAHYLLGQDFDYCIKQAHDYVIKTIRESSQYDYDIREGLLIEKTLSILE